MCQNWLPVGRQIKPKIDKSRKKDPKNTSKTNTSKNIENIRFWEGPGPAESSWDCSENAVLTNSPNHQKVVKIDPKSIYLGAPQDTKITKSAEKWPPEKHLKNKQHTRSQKYRKRLPKGGDFFLSRGICLPPFLLPSTKNYKIHKKHKNIQKYTQKPSKYIKKTSE